MRLFKQIKKSLKQLSDWRQLLWKIKPTADFIEKEIPTPPNYSSLSSWAAHPQKKSKVHYTPKGIKESDSWKKGEVDCFFVHPTLFFSPHNWNATINNPSTNELIDELIIPGQASVFNSCCRIFAPRYRQATFYSFLHKSANSRKALTLAGDDILQAFDTYLKNWNKGRPFFLAGHSQGALHLIRLLEERINNTPLVQQLVAAYPIGYQFPMDKFKRTLSSFSASTSATDLHSIITWDTYLERGKPLSLFDKAVMCYFENGELKWERRAFKKLLGHNPLNWERSKKWVIENAHKGGVHTIIDRQQKMTIEQVIAQDPIGLNCLRLSAPIPNQVKAKIGRRGLLFVSPPTHRLFRNFALPGGSLHVFDIALFYMDLRENIQLRWKVFQEEYKKQ